MSRKPDFIPTQKRNRGRNDEGLIMKDRAKFISASFSMILIASFKDYWQYIAAQYTSNLLAHKDRTGALTKNIKWLLLTI